MRLIFSDLQINLQHSEKIGAGLFPSTKSKFQQGITPYVHFPSPKVAQDHRMFANTEHS